MGVRLLLRCRLRDRSRGEYDLRVVGLLERPRLGERDLSRCDLSVDDLAINGTRYELDDRGGCGDGMTELRGKCVGSAHNLGANKAVIPQPGPKLK
jgi:hypothetical protein